MITAVLGAPGSGKSTLARPLATSLPAHAVLDWDALMDPAAALAGRPIQQSPDTWPAYRDLIRAVVGVVTPLAAVLLGDCIPGELRGWPVGAWLLLDCTDRERRRRQSSDARHADIEAAITDGRQYRTLGLPAIGTTSTIPGRRGPCPVRSPG